MDQILRRARDIWLAADTRRRTTLALGGAAFAALLYLLIRTALTPNMALLYSGLEGSAANGVIEGLERQGLPYEVRGDAIYVPASERDKARIRLAGEGLPAAGAAGYELLDNLSGFGTTAEMFDAAYWRAKEGELARTLLASQQVVRARVHIAQSRRRPFEPATPVTASATVTTSNGALSKPQAEAIRHLVASAVAGLSVHDVAVIDQDRGVVLKSGDQEGETSIAEDADSQAEALRARITRLLEARVGHGAAIVEVSVDTARASETIRQRILDPQGKIAIHTETEESADSANGSADSVTVASNLPDGDVEGGADSSSRQTSRTRERTNYEVSETVRETVEPPGAIKRISVAVLLDGVRVVGEDGVESWSPRPAEELAALEALVRSAIGFSEERGDAVTIQSLEIAAPEFEGTEAPSAVSNFLSLYGGLLAQVAALTVAAAAVGLFVLRPILSGATPGVQPQLAAPAETETLESGAEILEPEESTLASDGSTDDLSDGAVADADDFGFGDVGGFGGGPVALPGMIGDEADLRGRIEAAVSANPERAIEVVREWLDGKGDSKPVDRMVA